MKRSSTGVGGRPLQGYNGGVVLARLIAILTLGAATVTAGGTLISAGHQVVGLLLDVLAVVAMRAAVEVHPQE